MARLSKSVPPWFCITGLFLYPKVVVKSVLKGTAVLILLSPLLLLLLALYFLGQGIYENRNNAASGIVLGVTVVVDLLDLVRVYWNSASLFLPDIYNFYNFSFYLVTNVYLDIREYFCPVWPPTNIEADCKPLYDTITFFINLFSYFLKFIEITKTFIDLMIEILTPVLCLGSVDTNTGECSVDFFTVLSWLYDFIYWVFNNFLRPIGDLVDYIFTNIIGSTDLNDMTDIQAIWDVLVQSTDLLLKAIARFAIDCGLSLFDRFLCSIFVQPIPCFLRQTCKLFMVDRVITIPVFCWLNTAGVWQCPTINLPFSSVCTPLENGQVCQCEMCANPFGIGVPCLLGSPLQGSTCKCYKSLTSYDDFAFFFEFLGIPNTRWS